ncbi:hypothetical protein [Enterobacter soli]|nr:hypothetical protein [Enterobacter soli]
MTSVIITVAGSDLLLVLGYQPVNAVVLPGPTGINGSGDEMDT